MAYRSRNNRGSHKRPRMTREQQPPSPPPPPRPSQLRLSQAQSPQPPRQRPQDLPLGWVPPALTAWQIAASQAQPQVTAPPSPPLAPPTSPSLALPSEPTRVFTTAKELERAAGYQQWAPHLENAITSTQSSAAGTATELVQRAQAHLEATTNYRRLFVPPAGAEATPPTRMNLTKMYDNTNHPFRLPGWPTPVDPYTAEGRAGLRQVLWISMPPELQKGGPHA